MGKLSKVNMLCPGKFRPGRSFFFARLTFPRDSDRRIERARAVPRCALLSLQRQLALVSAAEPAAAAATLHGYVATVVDAAALQHAGRHRGFHHQPHRCAAEVEDGSPLGLQRTVVRQPRRQRLPPCGRWHHVSTLFKLGLEHCASCQRAKSLRRRCRSVSLCTRRAGTRPRWPTCSRARPRPRPSSGGQAGQVACRSCHLSSSHEHSSSFCQPSLRLTAFTPASPALYIVHVAVAAQRQPYQGHSLDHRGNCIPKRYAKTVVLSRLCIKTISLPRQARDKHRQNSKDIN